MAQGQQHLLPALPQEHLRMESHHSLLLPSGKERMLALFEVPCSTKNTSLQSATGLSICRSRCHFLGKVKSSVMVITDVPCVLQCPHLLAQ